MTKFRTGLLRSRIEGRDLLDSTAGIIPGSRVAAMTGHAIPDVERELIARDRSFVFRLQAGRNVVTALRGCPLYLTRCVMIIGRQTQHLSAGGPARNARRDSSTR
jgi:hypothetical protein